MRQLGPLEAEIMDRFWRWNRPATVREVADDLNHDRPLAYTTVKTVTDILHGKGLLRRTKEGRAWVYEPIRSREEHTAGLMQEVLGSGANHVATLAHFVEGISSDELSALRQALAAFDSCETTAKKKGHR